MRSIESVSTWPCAPAPSSATLITCRSAAPSAAAAAASTPCLLYALLLLPGVAEQARAPGPSTAPSARRADPAFAARRPRLVVLLLVFSSAISFSARGGPAAVSTATLDRFIPAADSGAVHRGAPRARIRRRAGSTPRRPGCCAHSASISSRVSSMNAVVNASATAAGASARPRVGRPDRSRRPRQRRPTRRAARAPARPCADPRCGRLLRTPDAPSAVWRTESRASTRDGLARIAQRQRPAVAARRRLQRERPS